MKLFLYLLFQLFFIAGIAQSASKPPVNIFIITTDGLRWQEVFNGADDRIMQDTSFVKDPELTFEMYGGSSAEDKRRKLMPFFWSTLQKKGQLHGNRVFNNNVDVSNFYRVSYPGYNEILTGYADPFIMKNKPRLNKNVNLLEFLNKQQDYKGSVIAFSSWDLFPYILNEERSNITVNSAYENMKGDGGFDVINRVQDSVKEKTGCRYDLLTFLNAKQYLQINHPKVMFLGLGETDEFGHQKKYDAYLQQANNVDKMIAELWYFVQTDSFYKNNTIFVITTDHGRGSNPEKWHSHGTIQAGTSATWIGLIGPGINALGEIKSENQLYQKQLAETIVEFTGRKFEANHPIADAIDLPLTANDAREGVVRTNMLNNSMTPFIGINGIMLITVLLLLFKLFKTKRESSLI